MWRTQVRFLGAGAIGVAAIWSLIKLLQAGHRGPGRDRPRAARRRQIEGQDDRDISLGLIGLLSAVCLVMIGWLLYGFIGGTPLAGQTWSLVLGGVLFTVVIGGFVATVAGYMAGLIGASNSPVSGIGILATVAVALLLAVFAQPSLGADATNALVAFALFTVSIVFSIATISNDNLQDLKTGQLVGASPWKQQVALIVGVIAGSLVDSARSLDLLNRAYGFPGDPNRAAISADPLPAPQAALISTLARGVLNAQLDWKMIGIGALVGLACIFIDEILGALKTDPALPARDRDRDLPADGCHPARRGRRADRLALRPAMDRRGNAEMAKRFGVLLASGLIVGESLLGVLNAGLIVATGAAAPLAVVGRGLCRCGALGGHPALRGGHRGQLPLGFPAVGAVIGRHWNQTTQVFAADLVRPGIGLGRHHVSAMGTRNDSAIPRHPGRAGSTGGAFSVRRPSCSPDRVSTAIIVGFISRRRMDRA